MIRIREIFVLMFSALLSKFPRPLSSRSSYLLPAALRPRSLDLIIQSSLQTRFSHETCIPTICLNNYYHHRVAYHLAFRRWLFVEYIPINLPCHPIYHQWLSYVLLLHIFVRAVYPVLFLSSTCFTADLSWYTIALFILPSRFFPSLSDHDYDASDVSSKFRSIHSITCLVSSSHIAIVIVLASDPEARFWFLNK